MISRKRNNFFYILIFLIMLCAGINTVSAETFQNNLLKTDLHKNSLGEVKLTLFTLKPYKETVIVNKKDTCEYTILLPETSNSLTSKPSFTSVADAVKDIEIKTQQYQNGIKGYTKITIYTYKPVEIAPNVQTLSVVDYKLSDKDYKELISQTSKKTAVKSVKPIEKKKISKSKSLPQKSKSSKKTIQKSISKQTKTIKKQKETKPTIKEEQKTITPVKTDIQENTKKNKEQPIVQEKTLEKNESSSKKQTFTKKFHTLIKIIKNNIYLVFGAILAIFIFFIILAKKITRNISSIKENSITNIEEPSQINADYSENIDNNESWKESFQTHVDNIPPHEINTEQQNESVQTDFVAPIEELNELFNTSSQEDEESKEVQENNEPEKIEQESSEYYEEPPQQEIYEEQKPEEPEIIQESEPELPTEEVDQQIQEAIEELEAQSQQQKQEQQTEQVEQIVKEDYQSEITEQEIEQAAQEYDNYEESFQQEIPEDQKEEVFEEPKIIQEQELYPEEFDQQIQEAVEELETQNQQQEQEYQPEQIEQNEQIIEDVELYQPEIIEQETEQIVQEYDNNEEYPIQEPLAQESFYEEPSVQESFESYEEPIQEEFIDELSDNLDEIIDIDEPQIQNTEDKNTFISVLEPQKTEEDFEELYSDEQTTQFEESPETYQQESLSNDLDEFLETENFDYFDEEKSIEELFGEDEFFADQPIIEKFAPQEEIKTEITEDTNIISEIPIAEQPKPKQKPGFVPKQQTITKESKSTVSKKEFIIDDTKGFYLVDYENTTALIGKIEKEVFVLKRFNKKITSPLQARLDELKTNNATFMARVGDFRGIIEVTPEKMNLLIEL